MKSKKKDREKCAATRHPHFFKVLLGDFTQRLKIPPNFLKHIFKEAAMQATLKGPSGRHWQVELVKDMKGTFLASGWENFVKDHTLKEHEFLVFRYDGDLNFTVLIFDTTACEREDVFSPKCNGTSTIGEVKKKRGRPPKQSSDVVRVIKTEPSESDLTALAINNCHRENQLQVDSSKSVLLEVRRSRISSPLKIKQETVELSTCVVRSPARSRKGYVSKRRPVTDEERLKASEAASKFTSPFPYTVMCMTTMHVSKPYMLRFPTSFSRPNLPRDKTKIVLRDPSGKAWLVVYIPSTRDRLSGGWCAFARGNHLEEGDYCAFEIIGPMELRVHVFRVVEEIG
ncbi:B3 domain-containing protein Os01g0723500-like [Typha angustifolia]|uniref:B3 domain-containing protein Os01g0723500-like n=1 Tax=Typha angustifolia TaxID=59011 RepID=UPI003C2DA1F7